MVKGVRAFPLNIPGTTFHYAYQCRKNLRAIFREELDTNTTRVDLLPLLPCGLSAILQSLPTFSAKLTISMLRRACNCKETTDRSFVKRGLNVVGWMNNTLLTENRLEDEVEKKRTGVGEETVEAILDIAAGCKDGNLDDRPSRNQVLQLFDQEVASPWPSDLYESHSDQY